jgi:hypothetical protein
MNDTRPIRDYLHDELEKIGLYVTLDLEMGRDSSQAYPILFVRKSPKDDPFAEIHLMNDATIKVIACFICRAEWSYHLSDPKSFEKVLFKTQELLHKAAAITEGG